MIPGLARCGTAHRSPMDMQAAWSIRPGPAGQWHLVSAGHGALPPQHGAGAGEPTRTGARGVLQPGEESPTACAAAQWAGDREGGPATPATSTHNGAIAPA